MQIFDFLDNIFFISLVIFNFSFITLVCFFIWGAFVTEKIRKIVFKLGKEKIDSSDVEELIDLLEKHEVPLRPYARQLLRSAYGLVEINGRNLELELKLKLHRSILRRGILL